MRLPRPSLRLTVRLEAMAITTLILTGVSVVVATEPVALVAETPGVLAAPRDVAERTSGSVSAARPGPSTQSRASAPSAAAARPVAAAAVQAPAARRWLPTGTGMWTHMWERTEGGNPAAIVARAKAMGLTHLYVRTGTKAGGFVGGPILERLLPATKNTGISVIAWDFPYLRDPVADARRLAKAALYRPKGKGVPLVAAVAPDIETASEGTNLSAAKVDLYYRELRRVLPKHVAILATVPWPSEHRLGKYPYAVTARYADAFVPMAYWINRDPVVVTQQTMRRLAVYGKPVMPAGQAYDPRMDVPTLRLGPPSAAQVAAFAKAARDLGAPSVSLWVWNTATRAQWGALSSSRVLFQPKAKAPALTPAARTRKPAPQGSGSVRTVGQAT